MSFPEDQVQELKALYGNVSVAGEGGVDYFVLPKLPLPEGCQPSMVEALLCPSPRDGYPSRLFYAERPTSRGAPNWNAQVRLLERNWYGFSWRINDPGPLRLAQVVQAHLRGLR